LFFFFFFLPISCTVLWKTLGSVLVGLGRNIEGQLTVGWGRGVRLRGGGVVGVAARVRRVATQ
jgi:hypothetical protein